MTDRPFLLGLTGSIGMGKSTTADMFAELSVPVWDADAAVMRLYSAGGKAVPEIGRLAPTAIVDAAVDKNRLRQAVMDRPELLDQIEAAVHPLVSAERNSFITQNAKERMLLFDIPLLFETGADKWLDAVVVVTASTETQKSRVMSRKGMTSEVFERILSRQIPDAEKRRRSDHIISTENGLAATKHDVASLIRTIQAENPNA